MKTVDLLCTLMLSKMENCRSDNRCISDFAKTAYCISYVAYM